MGVPAGLMPAEFTGSELSSEFCNLCAALEETSVVAKSDCNQQETWLCNQEWWWGTRFLEAWESAHKVRCRGQIGSWQATFIGARFAGSVLPSGDDSLNSRRFLSWPISRMAGIVPSTIFPQFDHLRGNFRQCWGVGGGPRVELLFMHAGGASMASLHDQLLLGGSLRCRVSDRRVLHSHLHPSHTFFGLCPSRQPLQLLTCVSFVLGLDSPTACWCWQEEDNSRVIETLSKNHGVESGWFSPVTSPIQQQLKMSHLFHWFFISLFLFVRVEQNQERSCYHIFCYEWQSPMDLRDKPGQPVFWWFYCTPWSLTVPPQEKGLRPKRKVDFLQTIISQGLRKFLKVYIN